MSDSLQQTSQAPLTTCPEARRVLAALEQDWRRMSGDRAAALDVAQMKTLDTALPYAFMLERTAPGAARIRVAGQATFGLLGMEPRGLSVSTFFSDSARGTLLEMVDAAFTLPAIVGLPLTLNRRMRRKPARATALFLPMPTTTERPGRVLGAIVPDELTALRGVRFDLDHEAGFRCEPITSPFPDRRSRHAPADIRKDVPLGRGPVRLVVDNT